MGFKPSETILAAKKTLLLISDIHCILYGSHLSFLLLKLLNNFLSFKLGSYHFYCRSQEKQCSVHIQIPSWHMVKKYGKIQLL